MEKEYIERIVEIDQRSKSNTKRIDGIENKVEDIHSLTLSINQIATEVKAMREELNKVDKRLVFLEEKPSKRMDLIWGYIVSAIIGGLIGYVLLKLGLK